MYNPILQYEYASNVTLPTLVTGNMLFHYDAGNTTSYSGGSTWYDLSGNGFNGTINGATFNNTNYYDNFLLDGVNDSIVTHTGTTASNTDNFTITFWATPRQVLSGGSAPTVARGNDGFGSGWSMQCVMFTGATSLAMVINGTNYQNTYTGITLDYNTFYHYGGSFNRTTGQVKLYIQGNLVYTGNTVANGTLRSSTRGFVLGQISTTIFGRHYVSEVQAYNRLLTDKEVRQNYLYGLNTHNYYKH